MAKTKSRSSLTRPDQYLDFIKTVHLSGLGMDEANFKVKKLPHTASSRTFQQLRFKPDHVRQQPEMAVKSDEHHFVVPADGGDD